MAVYSYGQYSYGICSYLLYNYGSQESMAIPTHEPRLAAVCEYVCVCVDWRECGGVSILPVRDEVDELCHLDVELLRELQQLGSLCHQRPLTTGRQL